MTSRGFTLIEMLLAVIIFAFVGVASVAMLDTVAKSDEASRQSIDRMEKLQRALMLFERDIWQITPRQVRINGEAPGKVTLAGAANFIESDDDGISFSHAGWTNPGMVLPRSEVQLVGYRLRENKFERVFYLYPDAVTGTEPTVQTLLEDVDELKFRYMAEASEEQQAELQWLESWDNAKWPRAVKVTLTSPELGSIERIFMLPQNGAAE
ncbi:MAG: type II secretion system minor pseudopilin GspJ [Gammaproteobacteria bacterium]|jgi:general secretion pathway protein J|nr:type II secretion system minor pseudopilin GspJ [Gammaproteobacteria bacterium]